MEKIEVTLKRQPGPVDRPFERFYLSTIKHRLWRFFIAPTYLLVSAFLLGRHPITWIAVGFTAFFILLWTKTYIVYFRNLRNGSGINGDNSDDGDSVFIATPVGFIIDPQEDDVLIDWPVLSRFSESKNFFAFTIEGYPTLTIGKRHFTAEERTFLRLYASESGRRSHNYAIGETKVP